jgi:hypothetical protein
MTVRATSSSLRGSGGRGVEAQHRGLAHEHVGPAGGREEGPCVLPALAVEVDVPGVGEDAVGGAHDGADRAAHVVVHAVHRDGQVLEGELLPLLDRGQARGRSGCRQPRLLEGLVQGDRVRVGEDPHVLPQVGQQTVVVDVGVGEDDDERAGVLGGERGHVVRPGPDGPQLLGGEQSRDPRCRSEAQSVGERVPRAHPRRIPQQIRIARDVLADVQEHSGPGRADQHLGASDDPHSPVDPDARAVRSAHGVPSPRARRAASRTAPLSVPRLVPQPALLPVHPRTAPSVEKAPRTKYFWRNRNSRITGMVVKTTAALIPVQSLPFSDWKVCRPTSMGRSWSDFVMK